jgi:hypothetical protein
LRRSTSRAMPTDTAAEDASGDGAILVRACSCGSNCRECHGRARVVVERGPSEPEKLCPVHWGFARREYERQGLAITYADGAEAFSGAG